MRTMAAVLLARRRRRNQRARRERIFHLRFDLFGMSGERIIGTYRFPRAVIMELLAELREDLESRTRRTKAIPPLTKLLASLHFLASGSFQTTVGAVAGISQPSFSVILSEVLTAFLRRMGRYIVFPRTENARLEIKRAFHAVAGFPRVIGAIDCTHVLSDSTSSHGACVQK